MTADAVSVTVAAVRTISHHLASYRCIERHLLIVPIVVVQRDEPKAGLHEASDVAMNCRLISGARRSRVEAAENLLEVVLRVGRQSVASRIKADRGAARNREIKLHVSLLSRQELHVPIAVRRNHALQSLAQLDFGELRVVGRNRSRTRQIAGCECNRIIIERFASSRCGLMERKLLSDFNPSPSVSPARN